MTQKELLYLEDAIGHESEMISVLSETIELLEDDNLMNYLGDELKTHQEMKEELINLLGGKIND